MALNREVGLLTELLLTGDMSVIVDNQITSKFFTGSNKKAFQYIVEHQSLYGQVPTLETFLDKCPSAKLNMKDDALTSTGESLKFWCDQVRDKMQYNALVDTLEKTMELMNNEDTSTEKLYNLIKGTILKIENDVVQSERIKINEKTDNRWEEYKKRQRSGGITGIPSGLDLLDNVMGGFNPGELITFMAYTGRGKSWLEIILAVEMAKQGFKVLFFTTEMATKMVFRRIDAVWNKFNYSKFKKGQLDKKDEQRYQDYLDEMSTKDDEDIMLTVEQATGGLSQISAKIDQYKPDIVFIDGAYLLEDEEGGEDNWSGVIRVWRGLHKLCLAKQVPIVTTTQSKVESGANISSLSFAKALSNEVDVLAVLEQEEQDILDREADLRFLKLREGDTLSCVRLNWDFDTMNYMPIFKAKAEEREEVQNVQGVINL